MGRRALRKIDPRLDIAQHLKSVDQLPTPWSASAVFGRQAPLEVEVGSGKGLFLQTAAERVPQHAFLGIEVAQKYARFAAARLARRGLSNAVVVHGDALRVFRDILPDQCCTAVHIYFPDPWWKKRHHKRRVMTAEFLRDVERVLAGGAVLHFWTDVQDYFDATLQIIAQHTSLDGPIAVVEQPAEHDLDYRTHFERRVRLHGEPIYRAEFRKA